MLRFVVLQHTGWPGHPDHYDLMLQKEPGSSDDDTVLATYSTSNNVFPSGSGEILFSNHDHRRAYLTFEGALSQQRGSVTRADEGTMEWIASDIVRLSGQRLRGEFRLLSHSDQSVVFNRCLPAS